MRLNHPETIPPPPQSMKKLSSTKRSLVPKRLGATAVRHKVWPKKIRIN